MSSMGSPNPDFWPAWSTWVLVAVVLTTLLTIIATLNDIF